MFFDGEEALGRWSETDGLYGSRHFTRRLADEGAQHQIKAVIVIDMIGDNHFDIQRERYSTPWLTDIIWATAKHQDLDDYFLADSTRIEDDHLPFLSAGVPSVDIIDLDYDAWHTAKDNLDAVSARSLQVVGDVVLGSLPAIEAHLIKQSQLALVRKTTLKRRGGSRKEYTIRLIAHRRHKKLSAVSHQLSN